MLRQYSLAIWFSTLGLVLSCGLGSRLAEAAEPARVDQVRVGLGGYYKVGYWTPVWITLTAAESGYEGRVRLETPDADGTGVQFELPLEPVRLEAGQTATVLRYAKFGRLDGGLTVIQQAGEGTETRERIAMRTLPTVLGSDTELLLTLGGEIGLTAVAERENTDRRLVSLEVSAATELPEDWYGYDGIELVAIPTAGDPLISKLTERQFAALRHWVQLGGRLLICVGEAGKRIAVGDSDPSVVTSSNGSGSLTRLQECIPGEFVEVVSMTNTSALENYARSVQRLELGDAESLKLCMISKPRGRVELSDQGVMGEQPMIVQTPFGLGQITYVSVDLDQAPLRDWPGRTRLLRNLLQREVATDATRAKRAPTGQVSHVGYRDLSGQLRSALDQFSGVSFVAFSWVAGIIMIYILLIGPVDYFFLRNVLRRMEWTWITFPLIACGFALLALILNQQLKGGRLLINQIDLVDADLSSGVVRGQTWAHLYSPQTAAYDIQFQPAWQLAPGATAASTAAGVGKSLLSWQGLPGTGLGGMEARALSASFGQPYAVTQTANLGQMDQLPIQVASTAPLSGLWWSDSFTSDQHTLVRTGDGLLEGQLVNPFPVELTNCLVLYSIWAYRIDQTLGALQPGQVVRIDRERPLNLEWRLTRRRVLEKRNVTTPWDPNSLDVPRLLEMMMFHQAAGGENYTLLAHRYEQTIDLSDHLRNGRAILLGQAAKPATRMQFTNHDPPETSRQWTFCRVVFPVGVKP